MPSAKDKLAAVTAVKEPPDIAFPVSFELWTYSFQGKDVATFNFQSQVTDLRVLLNISQASTVEIDFEDGDYQLLNDPLFAHWAWNVQDVSNTSTAGKQTKKFKPQQLTLGTNPAYLGDSADLEWVLGQKPIDFELGQLAFRVCGIRTQRNVASLVLEDRTASLLRIPKGHKSWDRSQHTRAQFVAMLCREAGVDYWIPEINVKQPVTVDTTPSSSGLNLGNPNGKGLSRSGGLTVLGLPMSDTQKKVAEILLGECHRLSAPLVCWQAILYAGVGETRLGATSSTYQNNSSGAIGVLQGTNSYWDSHPTDTVGQAQCFLQGGKGFNSAISMAKAGKSDPEEIAVRAEVPSIWPNNAYKNEWGAAKDSTLLNEINKIIASYGGPALTGSGTASNTGTYAFTRGANENSWDAIQRLASEVGWYAFVRSNRLWFVSGNYLFSQKPQLTAEIGSNGVDYIDIDLDMGERDQLAECQVYGRSGLWSALPGMVVEVKNRGPASGKWIVSATDSHPLDTTQEAIITLQKPLPKRAEPIATSNTSNGKTPGTGAAGSSLGTPGGVYWACQQLAAKKLHYTEGSRILKPLDKIAQGETLYDCSSSVSWVLLRGGFLLPGGRTWGDAGCVSGDFAPGAAGLVSGPGKQMTIWANSRHVFIELHVPGKPHMQGNTVNPFGPGFGFFSWNTPQTGGWGGPTPGAGGAPTFWAVHYPGT